MSTAKLSAFERTNPVNIMRKEGFTPGVIYGAGYEEGKPVQIKSSLLLATVKKFGMNARVVVDIEGKTESGAIKDLQLHPVTNQIRHIDIQVFSKEDIVKLTVPIHFTGMDELATKRFVVGILMNEVEITGAAMNIPEALSIDLTDRMPGDVVTVADLGIDEELRVSGELTDALVTVSEAVEEPEETDETDETVVEEETTEEE